MLKSPSFVEAQQKRREHYSVYIVFSSKARQKHLSRPVTAFAIKQTENALHVRLFSINTKDQQEKIIGSQTNLKETMRAYRKNFHHPFRLVAQGFADTARAQLYTRPD